MFSWYEVQKCALVSKKIQLIMRIITDDSGSQCRLSSKFGAPPQHWPILLAEAKKCGLEVVGVSFHVGSGCRDATRYEMALRDCKKLFEMAKKDYGFDMTILDIGGGFPGETHSLWNPVKVRLCYVITMHGFLAFNIAHSNVYSFYFLFIFVLGIRGPYRRGTCLGQSSPSTKAYGDG